MNLPQFISTAQQNGGGSYNLYTGEVNPSSGYMVALPFEAIHSEVNKDNVLQYILQNAETLSAVNRFFGLWFDNEKWYFDVSENVSKLSDAIRLGMAFDQLAIWDCENGVSIELPKRQTAGTLVQQKAYIDSVVERIEKGRKV